MKVKGFQRVIYYLSPKTLLKFNLLTVYQYWLGIADPKISSDQS